MHVYTSHSAYLQALQIVVVSIEVFDSISQQLPTIKSKLMMCLSFTLVKVLILFAIFPEFTIQLLIATQTK